jgi:hypothetical protein
MTRVLVHSANEDLGWESLSRKIKKLYKTHRPSCFIVNGDTVFGRHVRGWCLENQVPVEEVTNEDLLTEQAFRENPPDLVKRVDRFGDKMTRVVESLARKYAKDSS